MAAERYTAQPPVSEGWYWMKQGDSEQVVHIFQSYYAIDGVNGLWVSLPKASLKPEISLKELHATGNIFWSRYKVPRPSETDSMVVRMTVNQGEDQHNVQFEIKDHELFTAIKAEMVFERYLGEAVRLMFEGLNARRLKESRQTIHEHFALLKFIGSRNPELMTQFRSEYKLPESGSTDV